VDITVLCSDKNHPVFPVLTEWTARIAARHQVRLVSVPEDVGRGDILFLVSVTRLIPVEVRARFRATLVMHASDLPQGRGWSPHIWQVVEGKSAITVSVLSAEDPVDSGAIWAQRTFDLGGHELAAEINEALFQTEMTLMEHVINNFSSIRPRDQPAAGATYYRRRTPDDSRLDPSKTIAEQFDLLRVADPTRYPAFMDFRGHRYRIIIEKME
jgi:methionyl-tRNA formyltransferase